MSCSKCNTIGCTCKTSNARINNNSSHVTINQDIPCLGVIAGDSLTSALLDICNDCCLKTLKVSFSSYDIQHLFTIPIELIPDPGIGKLIVPSSIVANYIYNTIAYNSNQPNININFYELSSGNIMGGTNILDTHSNSTKLILLNGDMLSNSPLMAQIQTENPTAGDGTVDLYIQYKIINL